MAYVAVVGFKWHNVALAESSQAVFVILPREPIRVNSSIFDPSVEKMAA